MIKKNTDKASTDLYQKPLCMAHVPVVAARNRLVVLLEIRNGTGSPLGAIKKGTTPSRNPFLEWSCETRMETSKAILVLCKEKSTPLDSRINFTV